MTDINLIKGNAKIPAINSQYELWIKQRGQSQSARVYLRNDQGGPVVVTVVSGPDNDPDNLDVGAAVTVTLNDRHHLKSQAIPIPPGLPLPDYYYFTRIRATGKISVEVVSEIGVDTYTRKRPEL